MPGSALTGFSTQLRSRPLTPTPTLTPTLPLALALGLGFATKPWLRLNAQSRGVEEMRPELLKYACVSGETNQFGVPPLEQLQQQRLTLCTCAATHMLLESCGLLDDA